MLQQFDEMIVVLMDHHQLIGPWTRTNELNDLQLAACQLVPQTSSLLLGMREMIRQAYLLPAAIKVRPIIERVATLSWLCENPEGVDLWHTGWKHGHRPSLAVRMESMIRTKRFPVEQAAAVRQHFNSLIHGDPESADMGAMVQGNGEVVYVVSKDLESPARVSDLALQGAMYSIAVMARSAECFPSLSLLQVESEGEKDDPT